MEKKVECKKLLKKTFEEQEKRNSCELKFLYLEPQIKTNADRYNAHNNYEWITQILDPFLR